MAAEMGLDQTMAKRAGLLHDVGKSIDFEMEGSHVELGAKFARKYGEPDVVINGIESHHGDVEVKYIISHLVIAADTLSAARPGARSETLETYVKRLEALENICKSYDGVAQSYAMQSGREIRVMVVPEKIDDNAAFKLARDIKDRIEAEMTYPGQIKVSVIREYRAIETAK
jgi:ribonuclease Y